MSEEFLSNDRRVWPAGIRTTDLPIHKQMHKPLGYQSLVFVALYPTLY